MGETSRSVRTAVVLALLVGLLGLTGCCLFCKRRCPPGPDQPPVAQPPVHPPYDQPGSRGQPDDSDCHGKLNPFTIQPIPEVLPCGDPCGEEFIFEVVARDEQANCAGYSFDMLYQEAQRLADARLAEIRCPDDCPDRQVYLIHQEGTCANDRAKVQLLLGVRCCKEGAEGIDGLPWLSSAELRGPFDQWMADGDRVVDRDEEILVVLQPNPLAHECPTTWKYQVLLEARVSDCGAVRDYRPYIEAAERQAFLLWVATPCYGGCVRQPIHELGTAWECLPIPGDNRVSVSYVFEVVCKLP